MRACSKTFLLRFFEVQKTEQRYRERDNELISIQWQFQVKPNFAPKTCLLSLKPCLSLKHTNTEWHNLEVLLV